MSSFEKISLSQLAQQYRQNPLQFFDQWYAEAQASSEAMPDAMTLASVGSDGQPRLRTLLFKGREEREFKFFTNYGSKKSQHLEANKKVSLLFFWKSLYRQIRIDGEVTRMSAEESDAYWQTRPRESQLGAWASRQSQEVESYEAVLASYSRMEEKFRSEAQIPRPDYWGGFRLKANAMEFWQGQEFRLHERIEFIWQAGAWDLWHLYP